MAEPGRVPTARRWTSLFKRASLRVLLCYTGAALLLAIAIVVLGSEIGSHLQVVESWIASLGPWALLAFILLFVLATTLLVPETVMAIVAGALFGFDKGLAAVIAGGFVAAALQFLLSRRVLRAPIQRALDSRPHLASIQNAIAHSEVRLQVLLRLTPLNPATLSYMFGAAGVRFPGFLLACLALVPHQLIEVYFGYAGRHVAKMASRVSPPLRLHDAIVVGGLVACLVAMVVVSRVARKAVADRVAETQAAEWGKGTS
ncbi:MAG: VTT domain-containing protein [Acidobacteria bacterium]|jgi:uncharacterized membrane protein YdjX (TVP38/TMEM64 family)|nr:VTT domain-containing protein [Acidobacteriota bacterium]